MIWQLGRGVQAILLAPAIADAGLPHSDQMFKVWDLVASDYFLGKRISKVVPAPGLEMMSTIPA